jgi:hypothetical protein
MQMAIEIAVGQIAQQLQFRKRETIGMSHQASHDAEPGFLVKDTLQAIVCVRSRFVCF